MAKNKTAQTETSVKDFINSYVVDEEKKDASLYLVKLMEEWSGYKPKMWGPTIIGFGSYHYKYDSGHEGDAPFIGFSPRKSEFSLYVYYPTDANKKYLSQLGKFRMGKYCIYVKKISDINISILGKICRETIKSITKMKGGVQWK